MKILLMIALLIGTLSGCATPYDPNMTYQERRAIEQARMVKLRFFLGLMAAGGERGSTFSGNVGKAGREALNAQHIYNQENFYNDLYHGDKFK